MKRVHCLMFVTLVSALLLAACAPAAAPATDSAPTVVAFSTLPVPEESTATLEPASLKVGILNFMTNSAFFIAKEEGYFDEQGLDVELVSFGTSGREMTPLMLQGQLDVITSTISPAVINGIALGSTARFVADKGFADPGAACATDAIIARTELLETGTLDTPAGLAGLSVSTSQSTPFEYALELVLEQGGLTLEDLVFQDIDVHANRVESMGNEALDVTAFSEPWITRAVTQGYADVWMGLAETVPNLSIGIVVYGPSMMERDPEVGIRFMVAYLKAVEQFRQGKTDRNIEIISQYTDLSPEELREVCWPNFHPDGKVDAESMVGYEEWAFEKGYLDQVLPFEQLWDSQFIDGAHALMQPSSP